MTTNMRSIHHKTKTTQHELIFIKFKNRYKKYILWNTNTTIQTDAWRGDTLKKHYDMKKQYLKKNETLIIKNTTHIIKFRNKLEQVHMSVSQMFVLVYILSMHIKHLRKT